jgi:predicted ATPase
MALIEGFRVQNYRALRDIKLGRFSHGDNQEPLTPFTVVIGKNGVGKSTLFDAFGFVADCLTLGVETACDQKQRGGFERLRSKETNEPMKVFSYLLLMEDPDPPPFMCIEEPETGLYHKLLETLAEEFRLHATGKKNGSQLFVTTHQPYFVDALKPDEVWILEKGKDGFSTIQRTSDLPDIGRLVDEGLPHGGLWYADYLDAR